MALYPYDIPSLHDIFPNIPNVLGNVNTNIPVQAGQPINAAERQNAKEVTALVESAQTMGMYGIGPQVLEAAELREIAVNNALSMAMYMPGDLGQALVAINNRLEQLTNQFGQLTNQLGQLNGEMGIANVNFQNFRIISRNARTISPNYCTLMKVNPGDGVALALATFPGTNDQAVQQALVPENPLPVVGQAPQWFHTNFNGYEKADIIRLIVFYNDTFGIVVGDAVGICVAKFQAFLVEF